MEIVSLENIDIEQIRNALVVKHNDLIEARYQAFTVVEQRIILMLLGQIQKNDTDFKKYRVSVADFCRLTGLELNGGFYEHLRKTLTGLTSKSIYIKKEDGFLVTTWFADAEYKKSEGWIEISISSKLKPYLLDLKAKYTQYQLDIAIQFKSQYAIRLYERLKKEAQIVREYKQKNSFEQKYSYEELREFFVIEKKLYSMFKDFRKWVIEPAVKEISDKSDLNITQVEYLKTGRKITHVCFYVTIRSREETDLRSDNLRIEDIKQDTKKEENHLIFSALENYGISFETAKKLKNEYGIKRIERNIVYLNAQVKAGKNINDKPAFLMSAIQGDYGNVLELEEKKKQEAIAKKKVEDETKRRKEEEETKRLEEERRERDKVIKNFLSLPKTVLEIFKTQFEKTIEDNTVYWGSWKKAGKDFSNVLDYPSIRMPLYLFIKEQKIFE